MNPTVEMIDAGWKAGPGLNKLQVERILVAALAAMHAQEERQNYNCPCAHPSQCDSSCLTPAPAMSRNDDAGFVEFVNEDVPYIVREINGPCAILTDMETRKVIGYRVYDPGCSEREVFSTPSLAAENERLRAVLDGLRKDMDRCEHDGGYDREIGPIGCYLGDKCVCMPLYMKINAALEDRT